MLLFSEGTKRMSALFQIHSSRFCRPVSFFMATAIGLTTSAALGQTKDAVQFVSSPQGMSQVLRVNSRGDFLGAKEVSQDTVLAQKPFVQLADSPTPLPFPKFDGYSNLEPHALSDQRHVVGMISRSQRGAGRMRGFVWDIAESKQELLDFPATFNASSATDISADGQRIAGHCVGADPPRIIPCVWEKSEGAWQVNLLPVDANENTLLPIGRTVISSNGQFVAACTTVANSENEFGVRAHELSLWHYVDGTWQRKSLASFACRLGDVNDHGAVAGSRKAQNGKQQAIVVDASGQLIDLDRLPGDVTNEALGINNQQTVIGYSDDPAGPNGGPQAFVWHANQIHELDLGEDVVFSYAQSLAENGRVGGYATRITPDGQASTDGFLMQLSLEP